MSDDVPVPEKDSKEISVETEDVSLAPKENITSSSDVVEIENQLRIFFQDVGLDVITSALEKRNEVLGSDEFKSQVESPGTYEYILAMAASDHSVEADRLLKSIKQIEDKSLFDSKLIRDGKVILSSILKPRRPQSGSGKSISGREARVEFAIKTGQAKRATLYNSGFHIDIEAPTLIALNDFFTKAHSDTNQYSREFGANFFYFNDLLIKEALVELISPLILSCSLKNWNRNNNLIRNIKLNDLKVILNTIACLMFPDGFLFTHVCKNAKDNCTYQEELLIDLTKLFRNNYMKLTNDQIDHIVRHDEVNHEKVIDYQNMFDFKKSLRYENIEFELHVPSIEDHILYGRKFNADLLKSNFAENTVDVYQSLIFRYYQIYTPFIKSVTIYDENNVKDITSSDQDIIANQLSRLQSTDTKQKFVEEMDEYIASTEISHICYPAVPCPKCGHLPEGSGYNTVDPEHTFFILALKRLTPS